MGETQETTGSTEGHFDVSALVLTKLREKAKTRLDAYKPKRQGGRPRRGTVEERVRLAERYIQQKGGPVGIKELAAHLEISIEAAKSVVFKLTGCKRTVLATYPKGLICWVPPTARKFLNSRGEVP